MQNSKFNKLFKQLMEDVTTSSANIGSTQPTTQSGDSYAPGDSRIPVILNKKKKGKIELIKRSLPKDI